eukprot:6200848-Pleurochrysis_carterae.AAC.1
MAVSDRPSQNRARETRGDACGKPVIIGNCSNKLFCKGVKRDGERCNYAANATGYCGHHVPKCATAKCMHAATNGSYCDNHCCKGTLKNNELKRCKNPSQRFGFCHLHGHHVGDVYIKVEDKKEYTKDASKAPRCKIGQAGLARKRYINGTKTVWHEKVTNYKSLEKAVHGRLSEWHLSAPEGVPKDGYTEWFEVPVAKAKAAILREIKESGGFYQIIDLNLR